MSTGDARTPRRTTPRHVSAAAARCRIVPRVGVAGTSDATWSAPQGNQPAPAIWPESRRPPRVVAVHAGRDGGSPTRRSTTVCVTSRSARGSRLSRRMIVGGRSRETCSTRGWTWRRCRRCWGTRARRRRRAMIAEASAPYGRRRSAFMSLTQAPDEPAPLDGRSDDSLRPLGSLRMGGGDLNPMAAPARPGFFSGLRPLISGGDRLTGL